jgi:hypothetical protein
MKQSFVFIVTLSTLCYAGDTGSTDTQPAPKNPHTAKLRKLLEKLIKQGDEIVRQTSQHPAHQDSDEFAAFKDSLTTVKTEMKALANKTTQQTE